MADTKYLKLYLMVPNDSFPLHLIILPIFVLIAANYSKNLMF